MDIRCLLGFHKLNRYLLLRLEILKQCERCEYAVFEKLPFIRIDKQAKVEQPRLYEKFICKENIKML